MSDDGTTSMVWNICSVDFTDSIEVAECVDKLEDNISRPVSIELLEEDMDE